MEEFSEIQKLLRLKRYERPTEEQTQDFLQEFQRRQRNVLLESSLWRMGLERLQVALREWGVANIAYAGATAGLLVFAAVTTVGLFNKQPAHLASKPSQPPTKVASAPRLALDGRGEIFLPSLDSIGVNTQADNSRPRYVIDARPVSYELPASF